MKRSPLQVSPLLLEEFGEAEVLLVEGFVELAIRLWEGPSEPKILAWRRQSEPTSNFRPLLLGLCLERCKTEARNPRLNEQPQLSVLSHKNLQPQKIVESLDVSMTDPRSNVVLVCKNIREGNLCQSDKIYHQEKIEKIRLKMLNLLPKGLVLKVPHLDLLLELDNEDRRSTPLRQSSSYPSCLY